MRSFEKNKIELIGLFERLITSGGWGTRSVSQTSNFISFPFSWECRIPQILFLTFSCGRETGHYAREAGENTPELSRLYAAQLVNCSPDEHSCWQFSDFHHIPGLSVRLARRGQSDMTRQLVEINLLRSRGQAWGFRILGGRDEGLLCKVEKVSGDQFVMSQVSQAQSSVTLMTCSKYLVIRVYPCPPVWCC